MGGRSVALAGSAAYNSLPTSVHDLTAFKSINRELKSALLKRGYLF